MPKYSMVSLPFRRAVVPQGGAEAKLKVLSASAGDRSGGPTQPDGGGLGAGDSFGRATGVGPRGVSGGRREGVSDWQMAVWPWRWEAVDTRGGEARVSGGAGKGGCEVLGHRDAGEQELKLAQKAREGVFGGRE